MGEDVLPPHLVIQQMEPIGRFLLGLDVQRLLEPPELRWSCQAHANLPPLGSFETHPEPGRLPSPPVRCPAVQRYYAPLRPLAASPSLRRRRAATPGARDGPPVLRPALCRRATPPTPASDRPSLVGCIRRDPSGLPCYSGRLGARDLPFEACSGFTRVAARQLADPPMAGLCPRELQRVGHPPRCPGSYWGVPTTPRAGLSPARALHLSRHTGEGSRCEAAPEGSRRGVLAVR